MESQVSVVIPVYNGMKYLRQAVDSVLSQTLPVGEILLIDDGSTETSGQIFLEYDETVVKYHYFPHGGIGAARNRGIEMAGGMFIAFLDADDYWDKQKLALQLREIKKPGAANMIFGMSAQFYSPETGEDFRQQYQCPSEPVKCPHPGTLLMKRDDFLKVGLFSTEYKTGEFIEWYRRAEESGMISAFLPEVLMYRRIHPLNHGIVQKQQNDDYARIVKEMLLRRRKKEING
jgi:glycosyltransferase involved in cell wall biosynthesis